MQHFDKHITGKPYVYKIEEVKSNDTTLIEVNDKYYSKNRSLSIWMNWKFGIAMSFCLSPILIGIGKEDSMTTMLYFIILFTPLIIFTVIGFKSSKKQMVMDRLKGTITFPKINGEKKSITVPFHKGKGGIKSYMIGDVMHTDLFFKTLKGVKPKVVGNLSEHYLEEVWNFTVWYMDKNRPLPPGTAFDPYRQQDFERRKTLGFPKPLYKSTVPTPEATPEQQAERKKIGGW
ncbi:hypothetical protein [Olleya sp. HaHaR_3_96]|uniref:hypothetical protein n=1 Tax=Olleya sp. HaHaR_3_96 TaxID=2745560 RepID=UPI001C500253|nr:hypothetical protein [Olleya sp. HaHaR_3_96]QXP59321.1 hypothetical protein H0I26_15555 [Olleya sp. HaHaR_3_96]